MRVVEWLRECTVRKWDTAQDADSKRFISPPMAFITVLLAVFVPILVMQGETFTRTAGFGIGAFSGITFFVLAPMRLFPVKKVLIGSITGLAITCLAMDLTSSADADFRWWTFIVLILDAALVLKLDEVLPVVMSLTVVVIVTERAEAALRFGLYEAVTPEDDITPGVCDCVSPPCQIPLTFTVYYITKAFTVLLIDFHLTRGFASDLRVQLRAVESAVQVAAEIAAALAKYDVNKAESVIAEGRDLPDSLAESFLRLLSNLRSYRDYLPEALLQDDETDSPV
eukprot:Hpha_TRINITY_DN23663_c0_g1::TRINITY_DN23663_c0_g1_i1::g.57644::m.57644